MPHAALLTLLPPAALAQSPDSRPDFASPSGNGSNSAAGGGAAGPANSADPGVKTSPVQNGSPQTGAGDNSIPQKPPADTGADTDSGGGSMFGGGGFLILILVLVVMWVFLIGGQRKEKKKRKQMIAALAKGKRVQTIGGIIGTVVEVRDEEIVVKVDENANTRMRFARSAIQNVFDEE